MQREFILFILVSIRVTAMLVSSPVFSMRQIPSFIKVALSLIIGYMMSTAINTANFILPGSTLELLIICSKEIILGLIIGFIATLIFNAVKGSAHMIDFGIGFSMSSYYDPSTASNSTVLERLFNWIALILFLTFNFHHVLIEAIIKSFEIVPPGAMNFGSNVFSHLVSVFAHSFLISIQLAAPILIVLFLTDFTLGLISRAVPQIHIFILGMPIKVLVGLLAISIILPGLARIYIKTFEGISTDLLKFFNMFPALLMFANDDKTEEPTGKKLSDARKKGQIPKSIDLNSAVVLLFVMFAFNLFGDSLYTNGRLFIIESYKYLTKEIMNNGDVLSLFLFMIKNGATAALPIVLTVLVIGVASNLLQSGFIITSESIKPKFEKINPIQGFKRFFSKRSFVELLKSIAKVTLVAYVAYGFISSKMNDILKTSDLNPNGIFPFVKSITDSGLSRIVVTMLLIGIIDFVFQRRQYKKDLRMTKQEIKEEFKQMEGNPEIKSKIKQKQREMSMRRMMQEVPKATVVVTNPTHFAVALKYEKNESAAPVVVAKGADLVALKIKEIAKENKVPIVENKQLARTLYASVEINEIIPADLYQAVAEIIAYVYSMKNM